MIDATVIRQLVDTFVPEVFPAIYVVEAQVRPAYQRTLIRVLLDKDGGVQLQDCINVSRELGRRLEELLADDDDAFELEVSSPGVGEPLRLPRQYHNNVGRTVEVTLTTGELRAGVLAEADDEAVVLSREVRNPETHKRETQVERVPFEHIKETRVQVNI